MSDTDTAVKNLKALDPSRPIREADIALRSINVRFEGQGRHRADMRPCLLMTQSGHWQLKVAAVPLDP